MASKTRPRASPRVPSKTRRVADAGDGDSLTTQRERKRAIDRTAQRTLRDKNKRYIAYLERTIEDFKNNSASDKLQKLLAHNADLFAQTEALRKMLTDISSILNPDTMPQILRNPPERIALSPSPQPSSQYSQPANLQQMDEAADGARDTMLAGSPKSTAEGNESTAFLTEFGTAVNPTEHHLFPGNFGEADFLMTPLPQEELDSRDSERAHGADVTEDISQHASSSSTDNFMEVGSSNTRMLQSQNRSNATIHHNELATKDYDNHRAQAFEDTISLDGITLPRQWLTNMMAKLSDAQ